MTTTTAFNPTTLIDAIEGRDAAGQLALYAADAEITSVDQEHPPSTPTVLRGTQAIGAHVGEVCARDMQHAVTDLFTAGDRLAYRVDCRYPDGTLVACLVTAELKDGLITKQYCLQAWG